MSNRSTLQPLNPDKASDWPIGTNPNRVSEWPIGTGPVPRLSGVQVAIGKRDTVSDVTGDGSHFTRHTIPDPPPQLKAEWQGGSGIRLSTVDQGELILIVQELHVRFWTPPPIKGRMERGLWNASSAVDLGGWTLAIKICSLLTLMRIRAPA
jgi:hypothetical protein